MTASGERILFGYEEYSSKFSLSKCQYLFEVFGAKRENLTVFNKRWLFWLDLHIIKFQGVAAGGFYITGT